VSDTVAAPARAGALPTTGSVPTTGSALAGNGFYLRQFDLFRAVTCVCVVAQHSVLWVVPGGAPVGWGMVMVLHFTRNAFFFLSAFVAAYSQRTRPRPVGALWYRRLSQILVPYLVWTAAYVTLSIFLTSLTYDRSWSALATDLWNGYYQLYYLVVLVQFYVLLPGLLWLVRKTRGHHLAVLLGSFAFQIALGICAHYLNAGPGAGGALHQVASDLLQSRLVVGYQLYLVAGLLAADHVDQVQRLVARYWRRVLAASAATLAVALGYYVYGLEIGQTPGRASDLYQPVACAWFMAAIAGLYTLGWLWARRASRPPGRTTDRVVTWGSDVSGGYYLSHIFVLQLVLLVMTHTGFRNAVPWGADSAVLFAGTVAGTAVLVSVLLRTPLRWALTGPDRTAERAKLRWAPPPGARERVEVAVPSPVAAG
jgi:peptidoglycan/LPS O-acetylase OafA/YrhL